MVQIVNLEPAPNLGAVLGQAISERLNRNLNLRIQDMLQGKEDVRRQNLVTEQLANQQRAQQQQGRALAKYLGQPEEVGEIIGQIGADNFLKLMQQQSKQQEESSVLNALSQISGLEPESQSTVGQNIGMPGIRTETPSVEKSERQLPFVKQEEVIQPKSKETQTEAKQEFGALSPAEFRKIYNSLPTASAKKAALSAWRSERQIAAAEKGLSFKKEQAEEKKAEPFRKEIESERQSVEGEEGSLNLAEKALRMGGTDNWKQFLAAKFDLDPLLTPSSKLLSLASKEFLTGGLSNISAKGTNMFIEKRFLSMFPSIGSREDANESAIAALRRNLDVKKKKIELYDELDQKVPPSKLSSEVNKELKKYTIQRNEKLAYDLSKIRDKYSSKSQLKSTEKATPGDYLTQERADALVELTGSPEKAQKLAVKLGYKLPEEELE